MKSVTLRRPVLRDEMRRYLLAFLLGFGSLLLVILPIIIADGGYYIYYGDYNSQQIPFYNLANDAVRSGSFGWNWYTDLGVNFIGSYAFYLLGSPFFWLSVILPRSWVTFAMPVLLCMKHGIASLTAYAYIRRFVRNPNAALIGGMLYAFSGFQLFNIFFNHFQDVKRSFRCCSSPWKNWSTRTAGACLHCQSHSSPSSTIFSLPDKWSFWYCTSLCAVSPRTFTQPCGSSSWCCWRR